MLRQYILRIICCALICGLLPPLVGKTSKKILRLACGIVMTVTVLRPLLSIDPETIWEKLIPDISSAEAAVQTGQEMAEKSMSDIIMTHCQAYILDKAAGLGLSLQVHVTLSGDDIPIPLGVRLTGEWTQNQRAQLSGLITRELGIPEEAQQWIG